MLQSRVEVMNIDAVIMAQMLPYIPQMESYFFRVAHR